MESVVETVFLVCFAFGACFTLVSAVLGSISADHAGHEMHHPHAEAGGHGDGHGAGGERVGPIGQILGHVNLYSVNGFLTWFGAVGYGLSRFAGWPLAIAGILACLAGLVGALAIGLALARLRSSERVMDPDDYRIEGTLARVSVSVPKDGVGEVVFEKQGARRSEAARALDGDAIDRGAEVIVMEYSGGIAYVRPFSEVLDERFPTPRA